MPLTMAEKRGKAASAASPLLAETPATSWFSSPASSTWCRAQHASASSLTSMGPARATQAPSLAGRAGS